MHICCVAIRLRQWLVEHRARKMHTVVYTAELSRHNRERLQQRRDNLLVERRFDGHLTGILFNDRKREFADRHDDRGDITLEEEPADIGGQMVDLEFQQTAFGTLKQLHIDVQHGQREVAHRDAEELTERCARHRGEAEQAEVGQPEPAAHIDAKAGGVRQHGQ